jgi:hypothetical protein
MFEIIFFVVYIGTGSPVPNIPSKSCGLADENKKFLTEWKWFKTTASILCVEKDNLLSLTNICKTYILNTKQIQTNSISGNVRDNLKTLSAHHDSKLNDL